MSAEAASLGEGRLRAEADLGVLIRVTDGEGNEFGSGIAQLDVPLAAGLYAVGWTAADAAAETVVRIVGGEETVVRSPWESGPTDRFETRAFGLMSKGLSTSGGAVFLVSGYHGSTRGIDRSSLIVEVVDPESGQTDTIADGFRVLDGSDREVEPVDLDMITAAPGSRAWAKVTPGRYRLRFQSQSGETLDQVVPVLKDRTTVVRMEVATATVLVHGSEGFTNTRIRGVDPARTVIVTSVPRDGPAAFDEQFRLSRLLLRDLTLKQSSLSAEFLHRLGQPATDPLLRVYAALVILNCLEAGTPPALDADRPDDVREASSASRRWSLRAADLLDHARRAGMPPDAIAALWQAERMAGGRGSDVLRTASSIRMPPMLECAWRWAIARTTIDRSALQDFASIRAAAKSAGGTSPWLCWSAAAAKGLQNVAPATSDLELDALLRTVAGKASELRQRQERSSLDLALLPHSLPAEAAATALRAEQVLDQSATGRHEWESPVSALALALSLPVAALPARLALTDQALDQALSKAEGATRDVAGSTKDAPGWARKVRFKDDPNRGRFGGRSELDGFRLEAEFSHTKNKNWATIYLVLSAPPGFEGEAVMYLHNSFKPPRYEYRFEDGAVRDKLTAWGGFTVGAWIPTRRIELELNLAEVDGAPRIIRDR